MNDPAIYCINACAAAFNCLPKVQKSVGRFFWIKSHVLQEVNTALSDSQRSRQSLAMVAVLLLATYEAFGGNARISREVHVPGIIRLLALQGREREFSKSIPAPIMLHLRWCSDALARSCGTEPIFSPLGVEVGDVMGSIKGSVTESLGDEVYGDENQQCPNMKSER
ncbi:hypothetical protein PRZ48_005959 [Zasmidium cellare]|uniref:Uncharacterized protein n=1 Tax=Zasmidium cellare TaxID=395010 RepID=A0ABR0ELQ7_ZASCE|nr:hypothetical protein PRZ48_005959 [Zasmidium cellare]